MGPENHVSLKFWFRQLLGVGKTAKDIQRIPHVPGPVSGRIKLPGSKSYTNRVLPIAALARGDSLLHGVLESDDTRYMVAALQSLGIDIEPDWPRENVHVTGCNGQLPAGSAELYLGNSGTSMRFLTAIVALGVGEFRLDGTERMRERPLQPLIDGLQSLGVDARSEAGNGCPPVIVRTNGLPGEVVRMRGDLSSQYFTALALAAPYAKGGLIIEVDGELVSKPYLDMTAASMASFGVTLHNADYQRFWVEPGQQYAGREYDIEPDASAASYFFSLAAVTGGSVTVANLPASSSQGDIAYVDVLEQMGCRVQRGAEITVTGPERLRGVDVDMNAISDTVMSIAAIAPFADSQVTIRNVGHIRLKETDRISAVSAELRRMGIQVHESDDSLAIQPGMPQPATIHTYDDHRMAMSFAITGVRAPGIQIADPGCVSKTVPRFWEILLPLLESPAPV